MTQPVSRICIENLLNPQHENSIANLLNPAPVHRAGKRTFVSAFHDVPLAEDKTTDVACQTEGLELPNSSMASETPIPLTEQQRIQLKVKILTLADQGRVNKIRDLVSDPRYPSITAADLQLAAAVAHKKRRTVTQQLLLNMAEEK